MESNYKVTIPADTGGFSSYAQWTGLAKGIPNFTSKNGSRQQHVKRANKYMMFQWRRIYYALENAEYDKAVLIGLLMFKGSKSYQMYLFNKAVKGGYHRFPEKTSMEMIRKLINKCRKLDLRMKVIRTYVMKKNGKGRPIGAPDFVSRCISLGISQITYMVMEHTLGDYQHGYRVHRGGFSAVMQIIEILKSENRVFEVYEFDLKSFFNTVDPNGVGTILKKTSRVLAEIVSKAIVSIEYSFNELKDEMELQYQGLRIEKGKPTKRMILRRGLTQGLSMSPFLCSLVLEMRKPDIPKLVMYADDGVFICKDRQEKEYIDEGFDWLNVYGIVKADEKSGWSGPIIKFVGFEIDKWKKQVRYTGKDGRKMTVGFNDPKLEEKLKTATNKYARKPKDGEGKIAPDAMIEKVTVELDGITSLMTMAMGLLNKQYKGNRGFYGKGIFNISKSSSRCCELMLNQLKYQKYGKRGVTAIYESRKLEIVIEKSYMEYNQDNIVGGTKKDGPTEFH